MTARIYPETSLDCGRHACRGRRAPSDYGRHRLTR